MTYYLASPNKFARPSPPHGGRAIDFRRKSKGSLYAVLDNVVTRLVQVTASKAYKITRTSRVMTYCCKGAGI